MKRLLRLLAGCVLCAVPTAAQEAGPDRVAAALELASRDRPAGVRELDLLAGSSPGLLLDRLAEVPSLGHDGLPSGFEARLLLDALADLPRPVLESLVAVGDEHSTAERRARLAVLSRSGSRDALGLSIELVERDPDPARLARALEATATALHRRRADVGELLAARVPRVDLVLVEPLARALAAADGPHTTALLAELVGEVEPLDPFLLASLASRATGAYQRLPSVALEAAREALGSQNEATRREAIIAAARFDDHEATGRLVELLEDPHPGVSANALWALERLSNLRLGSEPLRWRTWHELNERWWQSEWPALASDLRHGNHQETVDALRKVAGRAYQRTHLAAATARVLTRTNDPTLLTYACLALTSLRSPGVAPDLVPLLTDPRPDVRRAAHDALCALTGLDLEAQEAAWLDALGAATR